MRLSHCQPQWSPGDMPVDSFGTGARPESSRVKRLFGTSVPEARQLFSAAHRVWTVPVREGLLIPFLATAVHEQGTSFQEASLETWSGRVTLSALDSGASSAFRSVINAVARLSSFAALPGGPKAGNESHAAQGAIDDLSEAMDALRQHADGQGGGSLLNAAVSEADTVAAAAVDEFETGADAGKLARWALDSQRAVRMNSQRRYLPSA